ncbi:MAG: hypothetical protein CMM54_04370 [Rhodospirillaceae bacterium]|nr:hypothetical protein [Rhodospirillaceae bacterium]
MNHKTGLVFALCLMAGWLFAVNPLTSEERWFTPHRGFYQMTLAASEPSSGIIGASGETYFEWTDKCDGWNVNQHTNLNFATSQNTSNQVELTFSGWEAKDGTVMRFRSSQTTNGGMTKHIVGEANILGAGGPGSVSYSKPEKFSVVLPEGTLFPSEYSRRMILRMHSGDSIYNAIMFDASSTEGPYEVSSILSAPRMRSRSEALPGSMEKEKVWPVRMAYFPLRGGDVEPDFEVDALVNAQGVAHRYDIDYGNFVVRAVLFRYEEIPFPEC